MGAVRIAPSSPMFHLPLGGGAVLRPLAPRDAPALFAAVEADRADLRRWLGWVDGHAGVEDAERFIRATMAQAATDDGLHAAVWVGERLAGVVGQHGIRWGDRATSLGYWLGTRFRGRGLARRAARAFVDHAFDGQGLHRVEIQCAVGNGPSAAVAEALGFTREGVLRGAQRLREGYLDVVLYSVLAPEWPAVRPAEA